MWVRGWLVGVEKGDEWGGKEEEDDGVAGGSEWSIEASTKPGLQQEIKIGTPQPGTFMAGLCVGLVCVLGWHLLS